MKTIIIHCCVLVTFLLLITSNHLFANRDSVKVNISVKSIEGNLKSVTEKSPEKLTLKESLNMDELAASDFHFTFKGASSGSVELISYSYPNDLWQKLDYSLLDVSFTIEASFVQELNDDILAFNIVRKTGTAHFIGKATQKNFGSTYEYNFDRSQQFDLENVEGTLQYSLSKKKITKLNFALVNSTNYPYAKSIQYANETLNVQYIMPSGQGWWFVNPDDIYEVPNPTFDLGNQFPTASFTFNPQSLNTGDTVTFNASTSGDPDGGNPVMLAAQWDFGDGTIGTGKITSHTYSTPGEYNVCLMIIDIYNLRDKICKKINVNQKPQPPVATFNYKPENPNINQIITFDANGSSDPDGEIISYNWDFGNGIIKTGAIADIKYNEATSYKVMLIVQDQSGLRDTAFRTIDFTMKNVSISGKLFDVSLENYGKLSEEKPLAGATVDLYLNNTRLQSIKTTSLGEFRFDYLEENKLYEIQITATGLVENSKERISSTLKEAIISPKENFICHLPLGLTLQKHYLIYDLEHLKIKSDLLNGIIKTIPLIKSYNEAETVSLIKNWNQNTTIGEDHVKESLAKLIITEQVLDSLYDNTFDATHSLSEGIYQLVAGFIGIWDIYQRFPYSFSSISDYNIYSLFANKIYPNIMENIYELFFTYTLNAIEAMLPKEYGNRITRAIEDAKVFIISETNGDYKNHFFKKEFENSAVSFLDNMYLSFKYVPSTQKYIEESRENVKDGLSNSKSITSAYQDAHEVIQAANKGTEELLVRTDYLQTQSDMLTMIGELYKLPPVTPVLAMFNMMAVYIKGISLIHTGTSLALSMYWLDQLENTAVPLGTRRAFDSDTKSGDFITTMLNPNSAKTYNVELFLPERLIEFHHFFVQYQQDYLAILSDLVNLVKGDKKAEVIKKIPDLLDADRTLSEAQLMALVPVFATAELANQTLNNFDKQYDLVRGSVNKNIQERIYFYTQLVSYTLRDDYPSDSLQYQADTIRAALSQVNKKINETNEMISNIPAPPFVLVKSYFDNVTTITPGNPFELKATVQNVGPLLADSVFLTLSVDSFTTILSEKSLLIKNMVPGNSSELIWKLKVDNTQNQLGNYLIEVKVTNGKGLSANGIFNIKTDNQTSIIRPTKSKSTDLVLLQNYPNPFKDKTSIGYKLSKGSNVTLEIININGDRVCSLVNNFQEAGFYNVDWNGTNQNGAKLPNGIYYCRLNTDSTVQSKKIIYVK